MRAIKKLHWVSQLLLLLNLWESIFKIISPIILSWLIKVGMGWWIHWKGHLKLVLLRSIGGMGIKFKFTLIVINLVILMRERDIGDVVLLGLWGRADFWIYALQFFLEELYLLLDFWLSLKQLLYLNRQFFIKFETLIFLIVIQEGNFIFQVT